MEGVETTPSLAMRGITELNIRKDKNKTAVEGTKSENKLDENGYFVYSHPAAIAP